MDRQGAPSPTSHNSHRSLAHPPPVWPARPAGHLQASFLPLSLSLSLYPHKLAVSTLPPPLPSQPQRNQEPWGFTRVVLDVFIFIHTSGHRHLKETTCLIFPLKHFISTVQPYPGGGRASQGKHQTVQPSPLLQQPYPNPTITSSLAPSPGSLRSTDTYLSPFRGTQESDGHRRAVAIAEVQRPGPFFPISQDEPVEKGRKNL